VLEGVFSDERGDYPSGTYVRNPPGSRHAPRSHPGCVIFVKLRQFHPGDDSRVAVETGASGNWVQGEAPGVERLDLHRLAREWVRLERWAPGSRIPRAACAGGREVLVLSGSFVDESGRYAPRFWLRIPDGNAHAPATEEGCLIYVKTGHLSGPARPLHAEVRDVGHRTPR